MKPRKHGQALKSVYKEILKYHSLFHLCIYGSDIIVYMQTVHTIYLKMQK